MRDICLISRDAGHLMKMRDCPSECGTVDTYVFRIAVILTIGVEPSVAIFASQRFLSCFYNFTAGAAVIHCDGAGIRLHITTHHEHHQNDGIVVYHGCI